VNKERFLTLEIRIYKRYLKNKKKLSFLKGNLLIYEWYIEVKLSVWKSEKEKEKERERARGGKEKPKCPWWKYNKVAIKRGD